MAVGEKPRFTIVGAGLAGALMACHLGKAGHAVELYEKRPDPRGHEQERGRSINLALSVRGIQALREVGLAEEVLRNAIPLRGRMIHSRTGRLAFQPYGKDDSESIHSVSRAGLNLTLLNAAAHYDSVRLFFQHKCTGLNWHTGELEFIAGPARTAAKVVAEMVIGADGVYSAVRAQMQKQERFNYQQDYLSHGYKELTMPPGPQGEFPMEEHALHIWPRHSFMMIALPNLDGSFTCTLFWPFEGPQSFAALTTEADIRRFFQEQFPDAVALLPDLADDFLKHPTGSLVTVRCSPWHVCDRVVLIGDACHAVVPFLGQGMNAAFEDCTVLRQCLVRHRPNWEAAFRMFEMLRKKHTDALADLCIDNFIEMRDRVGSRTFLLKKKFEVLFHKLFPRWYLPLYTLITFTCVPYAEARQRAKVQNRIVGTVLGGLGAILLLVLLFLNWR
jgi:kynurenine 3-monooxygenase